MGQEKRHILLCGSRRSGRSAMIRALTQDLTVPLYGYMTHTLRTNADGFHEIYLFPYGAAAPRPEEACHVGDCDTRHRVIYDRVFDTLGVELLAEPGGPCPPYGIYNSSSFALCGMLTRMGFSAARLPAIPDREELIFETVEKALASDAEVVFTTGGASVGEYDLARRTAERLGAEPLFWKIRMKPGGAILVSRAGSKLLISLSGNPAAAMMSLLVILRPWLTALTGGQDRTELVTLPLKRELPKSGSVLRLLRGHLDLTGDRPCFAEHEGRGNGNMASFAGCDLIGMVPGGRGPLKQGEEINALRLPPELC